MFVWTVASFPSKAFGGEDEGGSTQLAELNLDALDVHNMDSTIYKRAMGKWRAESIRTLNSKAFWIQLILETCLLFGYSNSFPNLAPSTEHT